MQVFIAITSFFLWSNDSLMILLPMALTMHNQYRKYCSSSWLGNNEDDIQKGGLKYTRPDRSNTDHNSIPDLMFFMVGSSSSNNRFIIDPTPQALRIQQEKLPSFSPYYLFFRLFLHFLGRMHSREAVNANFLKFSPTQESNQSLQLQKQMFHPPDHLIGIEQYQATMVQACSDWNHILPERDLKNIECVTFVSLLSIKTNVFLLCLAAVNKANPLSKRTKQKQLFIFLSNYKLIKIPRLYTSTVYPNTSGKASNTLTVHLQYIQYSNCLVLTNNNHANYKRRVTSSLLSYQLLLLPRCKLH